MRKLKLRLLSLTEIVIVIASLSLPYAVNAQESISAVVSFNQNTGIVTVSGLLSSGKSHRPVALLAVVPGTDINNLPEDVGLDTYMVEIAETKSLIGGTYSFQFGMDSQIHVTGIYSVKVTSGNIYTTGEYYFANQNDEKNALIKLTDAIKSGDLAEIITGENNIVRELGLGLNSEENQKIFAKFSGMDSDSHANVYRLILKWNKTYNKTSDFVSDFNTSVLLSLIKAESNPSMVKQYVESYGALLQIDTAGAYASLLSDEKDSRLTACGMLAGKEFDTTEAFSEAFNDSIASAAIRHTVGWVEVKEELDAINQSGIGLNIDLSNEGALGKLSEENQIKVFKAILVEKDTVTSVSGLRMLFDRKVEEYTPNTKYGGTGGGSSSGGTQTAFVVSALPEQSKPFQNFSDTKDYLWVSEGIEYMNKNGIIQGFGDGTFRPEGQVTRAEFVKILILTFGETKEDAKCSFTDVQITDWYYPYVASAFTEGIVLGNENGSFGSDNKITRQEMCVMAYRAVVKFNVYLGNNIPEKSFSDADEIDGYAREAIAKMQKAGIISGYEDGFFVPHGTATRAEAVKILYELFRSKADTI